MYMNSMDGRSQNQLFISDYFLKERDSNFKMKVYPCTLAAWIILAEDNVWVSTMNDDVEVVTVHCCLCLVRCHPAFLLLCRDGFFLTRTQFEK